MKGYSFRYTLKKCLKSYFYDFNEAYVYEISDENDLKYSFDGFHRISYKGFSDVFENCRCDYVLETGKIDFWILYEVSPFTIPGQGTFSHASKRCIQDSHRTFRISYDLKECYKDLLKTDVPKNVQEEIMKDISKDTGKEELLKCIEKMNISDVSKESLRTFVNMIVEEPQEKSKRETSNESSQNPIEFPLKTIENPLSTFSIYDIFKFIFNWSFLETSPLPIMINVLDNSAYLMLGMNQKVFTYNYGKFTWGPLGVGTSENMNRQFQFRPFFISPQEIHFNTDCLKLVGRDVYWNNQHIQHLRFYELQKIIGYDSKIHTVGVLRKEHCDESLDNSFDNNHDITVNHVSKEVVVKSDLKYPTPSTYKHFIKNCLFKNHNDFLKGIIGKITFEDDALNISGECDNLLLNTSLENLQLNASEATCFNGFDKVNSLRIFAKKYLYLNNCGRYSKDVYLEFDGWKCVLENCFINASNVSIKTFSKIFIVKPYFKNLTTVFLDIDSKQDISEVYLDGVFENSLVNTVKILFPNNKVCSKISMNRTFKRCHKLKFCELIFRGFGNDVSMSETFLGSSLPIFTMSNSENNPFQNIPQKSSKTLSKKVFRNIYYEQTFENCAKMYYCEVFTDKSRYQLNKKHVFKNMKGIIKLKSFL